MFGSKSRTRQAERAAIEADEAAQVAAEKALAAEEAQEAAREEIRARKRAEREQALAEAKEKAAGLWSDAQSTASDAKDKAQSKAADAKGRARAEADTGRSKSSKLLSRSGGKASDVATSGKAGLAGLLGAAQGSKGDVSGKASDLADTAGSRLADLRDRTRDAYQNSDGVQSARENAVNAAVVARQWAAPHVEAARDRGITLAAPRVESAASSLQPHVDAVHGKVVDDLLPKILEAVNAATATANAKADAAADTSKSGLDEVAGRAKRRSKAAKSTPSNRQVARKQKREITRQTTSDNRGGGRVVLLVGALGAGAVAAFAAWKANQSSQDPWAVATASTQPAGTTGTTTTTTSAAPQHESATTVTTGPMVADGSVTPQQDYTGTQPDFTATQTVPQAGGFGVDTGVSEGTVDDVRPTSQSDLPADSLQRNDSGADIHRDLTHTDLPQRAPVQAREPYTQETQAISTDPQFYDETAPATDENVQLDDDALQQYRRNRDILPGHEGDTN